MSQEAMHVFRCIPDSNKDVAQMMKLWISKQQYESALDIYDRLNTFRNKGCHVLAIKACTRLRDLYKGRQIHDNIKEQFMDLTHDISIQTSLINFYGVCGQIDIALELFESIDDAHVNAVCIGVIMKVLIQNDQSEQALDLYHRFSTFNNNRTHSLAVKACKHMNVYEGGKRIHDNMTYDHPQPKHLELQNTLVDFYGHFGDMGNAKSVFDQISEDDKDCVSINAMMTAYINNGCDEDALDVYEKYKTVHDHTSHVLALKVCANTTDKRKGIEIHKNIECADDPYVNTALIHFYGKCQEIEHAMNVFHNIKDAKKNMSLVNAMMGAYIENNAPTKCIELYQDLRNINPALIPDKVCYVTVLKACTHASILQFGQEIHKQLQLNSLAHKDALIQMHLINMYGKCGQIEMCKEIFDNIQSKEMGIYDAMLYAFSRNSDADSAMQLFEEIKQVQPVIHCKTYKLLIHACGNSGNVDMAMHLWQNEINDDQIKYDRFVLTSMVDCLARNDAKHNLQMWTSLLNGCRKYNQSEMAEKVYQEIKDKFNLNMHETDMISITKLMSHIYAANAEFDKMDRIRNNVKSKSKGHGMSHVYVNGRIRTFVAGDMGFDEELMRLSSQLKNVYGFQHDLSAITKRMDDDEKEIELCRHSEKVALMYGLMNADNEYEIVVNNNLRMCNDCHGFIKLVSKLYDRKLTVSDPNHVHLFQNGQCICNDNY
eukprot:719162_1